MSVKVGDKIRITDASSYMWENGDIFEVVETHTHLSGVTVKGGDYIPGGTYEVIPNEEGVNMTNTKAQVGDLIRIVNPFEGAGDPYTTGDILEVTRRRNDSDVFALFNGVEEIVADHEYVIHRKAGEEDSSYKPLIDFAQAEIDRFEAGKAQDAVNQPSHYTQGKFETIEVIEEITSGYNDGYVAYCVGNALKYEARAPFKHDTPLEDLRKAARYLAYAIDYLDAKSTQD